MKVFGTDGIRGMAGVFPIVPEFLIKLASAISSLVQHNSTKRIVIGKDTRLSCYMIENAMSAGFIACGMEVIFTGPVPTPAISMLTRSLRADFGIMISASHNHFDDNGIKIFGSDGIKISSQMQDEILNIINVDNVKYVVGVDFGRARRLDDVVGRYVEFIKMNVQRGFDLSGIKVLIDTANGSAYKIAPEILWELGCDVIPFANHPNGININHECGAVHPEYAKKALLENKCDIGIILDGDADRLIILDSNGDIVDGDCIIAAIALDMYERKTLKGPVVLTILSNLGLENFIKNTLNTPVIRTDVGDRHITKAMEDMCSNLGGEQSGHIVLSDYSNTGDGILAAIEILSMLKRKNMKSTDIAKIFTKVPQVTKNIKNESITDSKIASVMELLDRKCDSSIRIIIRKSGTEKSLVRIMVEGSGDISKIAESIASDLLSS